MYDERPSMAKIQAGIDESNAKYKADKYKGPWRATKHKGAIHIASALGHGFATIIPNDDVVPLGEADPIERVARLVVSAPIMAHLLERLINGAPVPDIVAEARKALDPIK